MGRVNARGGLFVRSPSRMYSIFFFLNNPPPPESTPLPPPAPLPTPPPPPREPHPRRSEHPRLPAEARRHDAHAVGGRRQCAGCDHLARRPEKELAGRDRSAADDDD